MALSSGTRLGPYEVTEPIGKGGMGEVYRARDTKLKRDVAIKVLPEAFASDEERMKRFAREAEVLASLQSQRGVLVAVQDNRFFIEDRQGHSVIPIQCAPAVLRNPWRAG